MSLTDWDVVIPAFMRALDEVEKRTSQSKEAAIEYLKEAGLWDSIDEEEYQANRLIEDNSTAALNKETEFENGAKSSIRSLRIS